MENLHSTEKFVIPSILGLEKEELNKIVAQLGEKPYRTEQLWRSIYKECNLDFQK